MPFCWFCHDAAQILFKRVSVCPFEVTGTGRRWESELGHCTAKPVDQNRIMPHMEISIYGMFETGKADKSKSLILMMRPV